MNSMTGYGRATAPFGNRTLTVQINSVNRRGLDLTMGLPDEWRDYEAAIAEAVRKVALRGKVHVVAEVEGRTESSSEWDQAAVGETLAQLAKLARSRGIEFQPTADLLWQIANAQRTGTKLPAVEVVGALLLPTVEVALHAFAAMRAREGGALLADFVARFEKLTQLVEAIAKRAPEISGTYREQLLQRLRAAGLELNVNDDRVLKEVALFADRSDISEEITRLRSHLHQMRDLLQSKGEIGRKAEFILQEIGREIHTIGSKANDLAISQNVIEFKNELERIREQIANVE